MSNDADTRLRELREYLTKCKIPLSSDDWDKFRKELETHGLQYFYPSWFARKKKWFQWLCKTGLDEKNIKKSLLLAMYQIGELKPKVEADELFWKEGGQAGLNKRVNEFWIQHQKQEAKKKRDRKPAAPSVTKNWLERMPEYNEGEPCGYVEATRQRRAVIEEFLHSIKAKPTAKLVKKQRGKRKHLYGFKTNCRVLDQWLGKWCDQEPMEKYAAVHGEAQILAAVVAGKSKSAATEKKLARLRQILKTHARSVAKNGEDSDFIFLRSRAACISEIKSRSESLPKPRDERPFNERFSDYVTKVLAGESAEYPS